MWRLMLHVTVNTTSAWLCHKENEDTFNFRNSSGIIIGLIVEHIVEIPSNGYRDPLHLNHEILATSESV